MLLMLSEVNHKTHLSRTYWLDEYFGDYTTNISLDHLSLAAKNLYIGMGINNDDKFKNHILPDTGINTSFAIDADNQFGDNHWGAPAIYNLQKDLDSGKNTDLWYSLPQWYKANNLRLNAQDYIIKVIRHAGDAATHTYTKTHPQP